MSSLSFTKLFSSITDSSVWQESDGTRLVWITMLSMADPLGRIHAAIPGLAHRARVPLEETQKALELFLAPDPYSRSEEHDGRRIEKIQGGWRLLNYQAYREMKDEEARKEKNRIYQERHRTKKTDAESMSDMSDKNLTVRKKSYSKKMSVQGEEEVEGEVEEESTKTNTNTLASTAIAVPADRGKLLGTLPLNDGTDYEVYEADVGEMARLYPAVYIPQAFRSMKGWLIGHPANRKTKKGIKAFITSWLSREQDKARPQGASNGINQANIRTDAATDRKRTSDDAIQAAVKRRLSSGVG